MVSFYESLLGKPMRAYDAHGTTLHASTHADVPLTLCPNAIAGVEAQQSRHQVTLEFSDLAEVLTRLNGRGRIESQAQDEEGLTQVALRDPDGNSLILVRTSDSFVGP